MRTIALFAHAYMIVLIFELLSENKNKYIKWPIVLLIGVVKYFVETTYLIRNMAPVLLCTILILYGILTHSRNTNLKNLRYALIAYGMDYAMNMVLASVGGFLATAIQTRSQSIKYVVLSIGRILFIFVLYRNKEKIEKIKHAQVIHIGIVGAVVLIVIEQLLSVAFSARRFGFINIAIACTYLAALYTILWALDHMKMAQIQKRYAEDNKQMDQKLHRSKEVLPMIANYISTLDGLPDEKMREKLQEVCHDYGKELGGVEMSTEFFETTGINLVDLLLRTKIIECDKQDIELQVFVSTQIDEDMKRMDVSDGEIMRMLGDLLRNAIRAVSDWRDRMILLLIARDENDCVLIRIYDSGVPFPKQVLENLGERGNTSWGTGNGLADLLQTLDRVRASIEINTDLRPDDIFSKEISICFDGCHRVEVRNAQEVRIW